jgi:hypothetical protein
MDSLHADFSKTNSGLIVRAILPAPFSPSDRLIRSLTLECGGNATAHGILEITSSSSEDGWPPSPSADLTTADFFKSKDESNQWIESDFKSAQLELTGYSIRVPRSEGGLQHWALEGRTDREKWETLDEQRDHPQLDQDDQLLTFQIANQPRVRRIRLRQTGSNHNGSNRLVFFVVEFF